MWNVTGFMLDMGGSGIPQDPGSSSFLRRLQVFHVEHSSRNGGIAFVGNGLTDLPT
jgi:hypothetical protein